MRLAEMTVRGFRRFAEPSKVRLDGRPIAFVGPNEAGKSTLLRALTLLNDDDGEAFDDDDRTRGGEHYVEVRAGFHLEEGDIAAVRHIEGGTEIRFFEAVKQWNGSLVGVPTPPPPHDFSARRALADKLAQAREMSSLQRLAGSGDQFALDWIDKSVEAMRSDADFIGTQALSHLKLLPGAFGRAQALRKVQDQESAELAALSEEVQAVVDIEKETPAMTAGRLLLARRPDFLLFDQPSRQLARTYDLKKHAESPPKALANLARLAGLDLEALLEAHEAGTVSRHTALIEKANRQLDRVFSESWVRPDEVPRLNLQGSVLHLLVRTTDGNLSRIDERSDGLRWFVALRAFLSAEDSPSKPVLLVDEAETHLSYDAQANLIEVLSKQDVAQKVLYTTHSAGCLPPGLGYRHPAGRARRRGRAEPRGERLLAGAARVHAGAAVDGRERSRVHPGPERRHRGGALRLPVAADAYTRGNWPGIARLPGRSRTVRRRHRRRSGARRRGRPSCVPRRRRRGRVGPGGVAVGERRGPRPGRFARRGRRGAGRVGGPRGP